MIFVEPDGLSEAEEKHDMKRLFDGAGGVLSICLNARCNAVSVRFPDFNERQKNFLVDHLLKSLFLCLLSFYYDKYSHTTQHPSAAPAR